MVNDKLSILSMDFAVQIIDLVKYLKEQRETIISNQIGRSGTSGANIREAKYAHGTADFISKLQIALKEANETGYWLEILYKTNYVDFYNGTDICPETASRYLHTDGVHPNKYGFQQMSEYLVKLLKSRYDA